MNKELYKKLHDVIFKFFTITFLLGGKKFEYVSLTIIEF